MFWWDWKWYLPEKKKDRKNWLHIIAFYRNLNFCKTTIGKHNFDVHVADSNGWAALLFPRANGKGEMIIYFSGLELLSLVTLKAGKKSINIATIFYQLKVWKTLKRDMPMPESWIDNTSFVGRKL